MSENHSLTPQERFDKIYITSSEISETLKVDRSTILAARRRGMLPGSITVPGLKTYLWEREKIKKYLDAWRVTLAVRRGETNDTTQPGNMG